MDLPIGSGQYELGKGYRVVQINADGTVTGHIGRCVLDANGNMCVEISVSQFGTFVVLPEAVEEDMGAAPTPMVASPLAAAGNAGSSRGLGGARAFLSCGAVLAPRLGREGGCWQRLRARQRRSGGRADLL